jgi:hypothetical protein
MIDISPFDAILTQGLKAFPVMLAASVAALAGRSPAITKAKVIPAAPTMKRRRDSAAVLQDDTSCFMA